MREGEGKINGANIQKCVLILVNETRVLVPGNLCRRNDGCRSSARLRHQCWPNLCQSIRRPISDLALLSVLPKAGWLEEHAVVRVGVGRGSIAISLPRFNDTLLVWFAHSGT